MRISDWSSDVCPADLIAIVAGTVAVRTATFAPKDIADGSGVALAAVPVYDLAAAVEHLSAAAQIPTISHQDAADNDIAEWDRLTHGSRRPIPRRTRRWRGRSCQTARSSIIGRAAKRRSRRSSSWRIKTSFPF